MAATKVKKCDHGGKRVHWFTSNLNEWEIKWCEDCGALRKYNLETKEFEWITPRMTEQLYSKNKK